MLEPAPGSSLGTWAVGDTVVGPFTVTYVDSETGDDVDLLTDGWTIPEALLRSPDVTAEPVTVTATVTEEGAAEFTFPAVVVDAGGEWQLEARFELAGNIARGEPLPMVVESDDGWLTLSQLRRMWRDTPADDWVAWTLLDSAKAQCITWAPTLDEGARPPSHYLEAQYLACRAIWNETQTSSLDDTVGFDAVSVRVWQMGPGIKKLLRPPRPKPVVR